MTRFAIVLGVTSAFGIFIAMAPESQLPIWAPLLGLVVSWLMLWGRK